MPPFAWELTDKNWAAVCACPVKGEFVNAGQCCSLTIDSWPFGEGRYEGSGNMALRLVESRKHSARKASS